jgi:hypothetical protein
MMLPENMARLLAAMQETVAAGNPHHHGNQIDHSTQSSQSSVTSNSKGNHHHSHSQHNHPLNFANINTLVQQPLVSSAGSPVRSPSSGMNGGGITHNNSSSGSGGNHNHHHHHHHNLMGVRDGGSNGSSSGHNGHLFSHKPKSRSSQGLFLPCV